MALEIIVTGFTILWARLTDSGEENEPVDAGKTIIGFNFAGPARRSTGLARIRGCGQVKVIATILDTGI